jgi:hypothetical protein
MRREVISRRKTPDFETGSTATRCFDLTEDTGFRLLPRTDNLKPPNSRSGTRVAATRFASSGGYPPTCSRTWAKGPPRFLRLVPYFLVQDSYFSIPFLAVADLQNGLSKRKWDDAG